MLMDIKPYLDKHTDELIAELSAIIKIELSEDVRCIQALVFRESLPGIPFYIYFLNRFKSTARGIKPIEPLSNLEVLIDSDDYIGREDAIVDCLEIEDEEEQDRVYQTLSDRYNAENLLVAEWFSECWRKAGGERLETPAFIMEEDGMFEPINLKTGGHIKHYNEFSNVFDG